jgi:hypothetical protein
LFVMNYYEIMAVKILIKNKIISFKKFRNRH